MIHILRWLAILGTCAFFWWLSRPDRSANRKGWHRKSHRYTFN